MNKRWEIRRVSTSERIFRKITEEMAQPVGIVIFGADGKFKNDVYGKCVEKIPGLVTGDSGKDKDVPAGPEKGLSNGYGVLTVVSGKDSGIHTLRHRTVMALRRLGMRSVVGIYVKREMPTPLPGQGCFDSGVAALAEQVRMLQEDPPTADGLDYLIIVSKEEEG